MASFPSNKDYELPNFDFEFDQNIEPPLNKQQKPETNSQRFANFNENELQDILADKQSAKTKKTTNWCVSTFKAWCKEKHIQTSLEKMTLGQLDANLRRFYPEARKTTGEMYSKKTLLGFRHAIERYMNQPPLNCGLKLSTDPRFNRSNEILDAQLVQMKRKNTEDTQHKPVIENQDLLKLKTSKALSLNGPWSLLRNVWFHLILFFCRRGREGQRELKTSSLKFEVDASGRPYATMAHDEATKNHPGGINDVNSSEKKARMYETDYPNDGYKALRLYLSKTNPNCESLFQYPKRNWSPTDDVWYENRPVGVNKLDGMMKEISKEAKLSRPYTNHSVRATSITVM